MTKEEFTKALDHLDKIWVLQTSLANKCKQYPSLIDPQRSPVGMIPVLSQELNQAFKDAGFDNVTHIIDKLRFVMSIETKEVG